MPTTDLAASIRFYRDGLGLELTEEWDDVGRGAILHASSTAEVELIEVEELADPPEPRTTLGLQVVEDEVDAIYSGLEAEFVAVKADARREVGRRHDEDRLRRPDAIRRRAQARRL